jgi:hypothetical protein
MTSSLMSFGHTVSHSPGELRKQTRDHFTPGKFVCPHAACFDHVGNILVVEWV